MDQLTTSQSNVISVVKSRLYGLYTVDIVITVEVSVVVMIVIQKS
ncbi:hypothetical protein [Shouchella hunanensis]|uniref:Uncharacterized protein n=1 Tax=Shouchella hunanensis TaxID=766894 RepID=A0ABY7W4W6_9BACI|nr:hypothetical protein [Shouchella hunanensis]WDF02922.1 hypothetical protein PQ477_15655 [Shouchella hunanensis]